MAREIPLPTRPCRNYALWLLGRREWSAKELGARLKQRGYSPEAIEDCLSFCLEYGLQSDERFAASRVRMRANNYGNRRISQELAQKGVSAEVAQETLAEAGDELTRAWRSAQRFVDKEWDPKLQAKAWRFLSTRGFSSSVVSKVLKHLEAGSTPEF